MRMISIDLQADFGFFRKPDTNNTINLSYNMIHKPAVLGILGAILGLKGYSEKDVVPEYYERLKELKVAIEPLRHDKGNYSKTAIKYTNTVGYANKGSNFLTEELTLVKPAYRIYLLLDENNELQLKLLEYLKEGKSEFVPYFGKNEFTAWWTKDSYQEYIYDMANLDDEQKGVKISTLFVKSLTLKDNTHLANKRAAFIQLASSTNELSYIYFERLPVDFDLELMQYAIQDFAYTNYLVENASALDNLYWLKEQKAYVQFI